MVSGDVDFGVTAFTGGFFNLAGKGALKIIAAQAKEAKGYEGNLVLASKGAAEKGFTDISQFAGKTLGISQVGSSFHYQIGQLARIKGFDLAKVDMKPLQSLPNMMAALKSSQVDGDHHRAAPRQGPDRVRRRQAPGALLGFRRIPVRRPLRRLQDRGEQA